MALAGVIARAQNSGTFHLYLMVWTNTMGRLPCGSLTLRERMVLSAPAAMKGRIYAKHPPLPTSTYRYLGTYLSYND